MGRKQEKVRNGEGEEKVRDGVCCTSTIRRCKIPTYRAKFI